MGGTLLIIEDEPIMALELKATLEQRGYVVPEIVPSADTVVEAYARVRPDLIIMDIQLRSYIDGIDSAHRLTVFGSTPILFLTANEDTKVERRARNIKNSYYVRKPYDEDRLVELIEQILS